METCLFRRFCPSSELIRGDVAIFLLHLRGKNRERLLWLTPSRILFDHCARDLLFLDHTFVLHIPLRES